MERIVRWRHLASGGLEHCRIAWDADGVVAEGVVVSAEEGVPFALRYLVACDGRWRVRGVAAALVGEEREVRLRADGEGSWRDGEDRPLPALDGCADADLGTTPLTNTLPVRRLELAEGQTAEIRVAFVDVPSLDVFAVTQRYTRLDSLRYRYEGYPEGFSAQVEVDADGLVTRYEGLFERAE